MTGGQFHTYWFILILCWFAINIDSTIFTNKHNFDQYIKQYNKEYHTEQHKNAAYTNYLNNLNTIKMLNSDVTRTWAAGVNQFTDLSPAEFKQQYLMYPTLNAQSFYSLLQHSTHKLDVTQYSTVADTLDWRNHTEHSVVTPIIDQGAIGSCYALSALETVSAQHALTNHMDATTLSVEQIIDCSGNYDNVLKHANCGVHGGWPYLTYEYIVDHGITTADIYDYCSVDGTCVPCEPDGYSTELCGKGLRPPECDPHENERCNNIDIYAKISTWKAIEPLNETAVIAALTDVGPLSVAMASDELQYYSSGIFDSTACDPAELDHAVVIVGYTADAYIVKNSWGTSWGEQGYFRVARNKNVCGIASVVTTAII